MSASRGEQWAGRREDGQPPRGEVPGGQVPGGEVPSGEVPSGEVPSGEVPSGEVPSGEVPSGEVPSGEVPSGGPLTVAVLGPGGVGGLLAAALERKGVPVSVVGRESTVEAIRRRGVHVSSVTLGELISRPAARASLEEPVDVLVVATKATGLAAALERVRARPGLVLPLLNGLDHLAVLRERFGERVVLAATIRVESDRPEPGVVVHTSRFLRVDMASRHAEAQRPMRVLAQTFTDAGIQARVGGSEAQVMWSKLVRLNALACTTSAFDKLLGEIRDTPALRAELVAAIEEGCAVARAEGALLDADEPLGELNAAHDTLGSSMQRDIAAGRTPELDAIPGAVLRAAARHGIDCPTIARLTRQIATRAGIPEPAGA